jgi:RNA 2',3'-cyclic 3'-phosphodiesterase
VFIAISLPEWVRDELERAQEELRGALPGECVRWTKRGQFHLTLKFLGEVESERLEALMNSVRHACEGFGVLRLRAGRIGFFPDLRHPRVIWAQVLDARARLPLLQRAVEASTAGFTGEAPEGTFAGHVTIGRCKMIKRPQSEIMSTLARAMENRFFGEWTAGRIELIRSELASGGPRYTTLAAVPLAAEFSSGNLPE